MVEPSLELECLASPCGQKVQQDCMLAAVHLLKIGSILSKNNNSNIQAQFTKKTKKDKEKIIKNYICESRKYHKSQLLNFMICQVKAKLSIKANIQTKGYDCEICYKTTTTLQFFYPKR